MYNDKLVYKVVIWVLVCFFGGGGVSLWKEKEALILYCLSYNCNYSLTKWKHIRKLQK